MIIIRYTKSSPTASLTKQHYDDGGWDICASLESSVYIEPGKWTLVNTGLRLEMPQGVHAFVIPRSSLVYKFGITILNSPGLIDRGYTGELRLIMMNCGTKRFYIKNGDRIAQVVFISLGNYILEEIPNTKSSTNTNYPQATEQPSPGYPSQWSQEQRGSNGFGSTGLNP